MAWDVLSRDVLSYIPEFEAHETLKRVASANAIIKHYKSSSLITVKRHAMVLNILKANLVLVYVSVSFAAPSCVAARRSQTYQLYLQKNIVLSQKPALSGVNL